MSSTGSRPSGPVGSVATRVIVAAADELRSWQPRLWAGVGLANLLPSYTLGRARLALWRLAGVTVGDATSLGGRAWIAGGSRPASRLHIGADCFINDGCRFDVSAEVRLEDGVYVGHDVAVLTATHDLGDSSRRAGSVVSEPVTVGAGAWVGARATILAGVTIGTGAVVAAGAVVVDSVPPSTLVGGVPAKVIRELD